MLQELDSFDGGLDTDNEPVVNGFDEEVKLYLFL